MSVMSPPVSSVTKSVRKSTESSKQPADDGRLLPLFFWTRTLQATSYSSRVNHHQQEGLLSPGPVPCGREENPQANNSFRHFGRTSSDPHHHHDSHSISSVTHPEKVGSEVSPFGGDDEDEDEDKDERSSSEELQAARIIRRPSSSVIRLRTGTWVYGFSPSGMRVTENGLEDDN